MKLERLEKAAAVAGKRARHLELTAHEMGITADAAKVKARQAKARLKLAKREVKQSRQAAKEAKRAFAEASLASEKATAKAAAIEKKLRESRKKVPPTKAKKLMPAPAHKPGATKPHTVAGQTSSTKPAPKVAPRAKPVGVVKSGSSQPAATDWETNIQVPREIKTQPSANPSQSEAAALSSAHKGS